MSKKEKTLSSNLYDSISEIAELETQLKDGHKVLDEIDVPKYTNDGKKMNLHDRLIVHKEQILDHLETLRGLLDKYRR